MRHRGCETAGQVVLTWGSGCRFRLSSERRRIYKNFKLFSWSSTCQTLSLDQGLSSCCPVALAGWGEAWVDLIEERIRKGEVVTDISRTEAVVGSLHPPGLGVTVAIR